MLLVLLGTLLVFVVAVFLRVRARPSFSQFAVLSSADFDQQQLELHDYRKMLSVTAPAFVVTWRPPDGEISQLPERMWANESAVIVFNPVVKNWYRDEPLLIAVFGTSLGANEVERREGNRPALKRYAQLQLTRQRLVPPARDEALRYFAVELLAPTFAVAGKLKQRQNVTDGVLAFTWAISASHSGTQSIALALSLENENGMRSVPVGTLAHDIKVLSLGPLTQRQINAVIAVSGAVTTILAILEALKRLG